MLTGPATKQIRTEHIFIEVTELKILI